MNIVVLTGAGISVESGLSTFRGSDGLWEGHSITEVASPMGYAKNPSLVLDFYNARRSQLTDVIPNEAHIILAELEKEHNLQIITQNVDDLHERAGSKQILHLHGELTKARSSRDPKLISTIGYKPINLGDKAADGTQLRPHIVWFGEAVPAIEEASMMVSSADVFLIVGTSLQVYPAAMLVEDVPQNGKIFIVDPDFDATSFSREVVYIKDKASLGLRRFKDYLKEL